MVFAFDPNGESAYLPHNCQPFSVVYTGTHDTQTFVQFLNEAWPEESGFARRYLRLREDEGLGWGVISGGLGLGELSGHCSSAGRVGAGRGCPDEHPRHCGGPQLVLAGPVGGAEPLCIGQAAGDYPHLSAVLIRKRGGHRQDVLLVSDTVERANSPRNPKRKTR